MFVIIGIVVVFGVVIAGYLMEKGNLRVLLQPAELIIIAGAAIGTVLIAKPAAYSESHRWWHRRSLWRRKIWKGQVPRNPQDDV